MLCSEIMTPVPAVCSYQDTVLQAARVMRDLNVGYVPIVDEKDQLVGIITDRDICIQVVAENKKPEEEKLKDYVTPKPYTCKPGDDISKAIQLMKAHQVRRIPIVDDTDQCLGIISLGDLAVGTHMEKEIFRALERISIPAEPE